MDFGDFLPNPGQSQAISAETGCALRVVAGAGTGKTEVIARRYAHLLEHDPPMLPADILVLTFTDKAAAEMRGRILRTVSDSELPFNRLELASAVISTFHSFGARLLGDFSLRAGVDPDLPVLSELETEDLMQDTWGEFLSTGYHDAYDSFDPLEQQAYTWHDGALFRIARQLVLQARSHGVESTAFSHDLRSFQKASESVAVLGPLAGWMYASIDAHLRGAGLLDYDCMILSAALLLEEDGDLRSAVRDRHRVILVDEYQDTNFAQERLLRALGDSAQPNTTVVGDPRQAIYIWREARVENVAHFPGHGLKRRDAPLTENFRSLKPILDVANKAIEGYEFDLAPEFDQNDILLPGEAHGPFKEAVVHMQACADRTSEAQAVADWIRHFDHAGYAYRDMAILVRARTYLPEYLEALEERGIPYDVVSNDIFYLLPEVLDAVHMLVACLYPSEELSLVRALLSPAVGYGQAELAELQRESKIHLWRKVTASSDARCVRFVSFRQQARRTRWLFSPPRICVLGAARKRSAKRLPAAAPSGPQKADPECAAALHKLPRQRP